MDDSRISLIFVPGIRPKPPVHEHQAQLRRCLDVALRNAGASSAEAETIVSAFHVVGWSYDFYGEHGEVHPDLPGIERLLSGTDSAEDDLREARSLSRRWLALMFAIWDRLPLITSLLMTPRLENQLHEVQDYFKNHGGGGTAARRQLAKVLQAEWAAGRKVVVVGHSFGSIIAYDTLWELTHEQKMDGCVEMFVSMGSPLTLKFMRSRLKGARKPGPQKYPANIRHWINLTAVGEVTALDRKLADCFKPMVELGLTASITDNLELVNQFHGPDGLNVHKCYGYFASRAAGELLLGWFRDQ